ncbi:hypothetical protein MTO96_026953 [Rhipicephalus appendiculatus]
MATHRQRRRDAVAARADSTTPARPSAISLHSVPRPRPPPTLGLLVKPPLLTGDSAAQLHNIAGQPSTSGAFRPNIDVAASLATSPTLQKPSAGTLGTAGENSTPTSTPDVRLTGDHASVSGMQWASPPEPVNVPLPPGSDSEDMDTTTTRKRLRPSEPGSDDEGASRKLQAVGPSSQSEPTQSLPSCVAGAAEQPSPNAGGSCNESEFRQVLSKAQKRRQRAAMPQGTAGNTAPPPGIGPATNSASRPPASCTDSADCKLWQKERRLSTIKASAPSHLSHREAQAVLRAGRSSAGSTGSGPPQAIIAGGKTYAAALSTPATELTNSVNHPEAPLQQAGHLAIGKKRGCAMPSSFQKKAPQSASNEENTNLRLLLHVVTDLLPPNNQQQLRSICLQAGGSILPSSHHG